MSELRIITRHTGSVLVGQLAVMAFGVADTVIAGRYSDTALAALSVGSALYISVYVSLMGVVQALLPIWAELHGARQPAAVGRSVRQSLYLCAVIIAIGMSALLFPGPLLRGAQVPELIRGDVVRYLTVLAFAFAPAILFRIYSTFNQSLGKPLLVTALQVGALLVKIPLSIVLVTGAWGGEPLGAAGCAWATLVVNYLLLIVAFFMLRTQVLYKPYELWKRLEKPDWPKIAAFARLGLPGGAAYLVEVTSFTLMAVFIARLGTVASASHQIASSTTAVLYMTPLSLAIACSARVSYWIGAGNPDQARRVVGLALKLALGAAVLFAIILLLLRHTLPGWYSTNPAVVAMASGLLAWVALFHLADATQAICAFLLRCYKVTILPMVLYSVLLWGLGLSGGYVLAYKGLGDWPATQSAGSFWISSTLALWLVAIALFILLWRVSGRHRNPSDTLRT
ncbi:MAG: MATE family efflux transporter [Comamonadaceae bacterium]|nr:MAG: MATE family efflux transporter [Comamonadaceae bacterium]